MMNQPGPIRAWLVGTVNQAALAAGAEATVVLPLATGSPPQQALPRNPSFAGGGGLGFAVFAQAVAQAVEANVQYTAYVLAVTISNVTVKVRNNGSAAGASPWAVNVLILDQGDVST
jgi:hypothetical protein